MTKLTIEIEIGHALGLDANRVSDTLIAKAPKSISDAGWRFEIGETFFDARVISTKWQGQPSSAPFRAAPGGSRKRRLALHKSIENPQAYGDVSSMHSEGDWIILKPWNETCITEAREEFPNDSMVVYR